MFVHRKRRLLLLRLRSPDTVLSIIPTARALIYGGNTLVAVPHRLEETKVLRNMGFDAPSPMLHYYRWPSLPTHKPFKAQRQSAAFMAWHRRAYNLSGMGSGKTLATLWSFDYQREQGIYHRMLVISSLSSLEDAWGCSIYEHFPHLSYVVLHGSKEKRLRLLARPADVYIINHDGIQVIAAELAERADIDLVVIDEVAHAARNARTDMWMHLNWVVNGKPAVHALSEPVLLKDGSPARNADGTARFRQRRILAGHESVPRACWALTGTPVPNAPTDAWAQSRLITPGSSPPYFSHFRAATMERVSSGKWLVKKDAMEKVYAILQPAIRFSREECVDLPPVTRSYLHVELTTAQAKAYKDMQAKLIAEIENGQVTAVNEVVKASKLVQIACGVVYGTAGEELSLPNKPRLDLVAETVQAAEGKTIVFVPFVSGLKNVASGLRERGFTVEVIYGDVSKSERHRIFDSFQTTPEPQVIVAQPDSMAHSLTLTAANTIIWYAPTNRADIYTQACERVTRPGQTRNTLILHIEGTPIERRMYDRLQGKVAMQGILLDMVASNRELMVA